MLDSGAQNLPLQNLPLQARRTTALRSADLSLLSWPQLHKEALGLRLRLNSFAFACRTCAGRRGWVINSVLHDRATEIHDSFVAFLTTA